MAEKQYQNMLTRKGLKNTRARIMVLNILDNAKSPMTVDEIFMNLKHVYSSINLSTVYRTIETLLKNKLIIKTTFLDENRSRYEYNRLVHKHHLVCTGCNRMISVVGCPVDNEYTKVLCRKKGFELTGHRLEIYGLCSECKNNPDRNC